MAAVFDGIAFDPADHAGADADVVVSTWPVTTMILGCLRLRGKVRSPVCATITDFAGLELWADRGVDLHVVMHPALVAPVERIAGGGSAEAVAPLVRAEFLIPHDRAEARRALGLPSGGRVVLVSGGGWGVGDLEGAARGALEHVDATVVCLAGRDVDTRRRLEDAFAAEPRVTVLGFTERMSELLAAADVLVHSTGGVTCLEAMARGCPIVSYRPPRGHSPLLAREMSRLGLVVHARSMSELHDALVHGTRPAIAEAAVAAAGRVLELRPRVASRLRSRLARPLALSAAATLSLSALSTSALFYRPVAGLFDVRPGTVTALELEPGRAGRQALHRAIRRIEHSGEIVEAGPGPLAGAAVA